MWVWVWHPTRIPTQTYCSCNKKGLSKNTNSVNRISETWKPSETMKDHWKLRRHNTVEISPAFSSRYLTYSSSNFTSSLMYKHFAYKKFFMQKFTHKGYLGDMVAPRSVSASGMWLGFRFYFFSLMFSHWTWAIYRVVLFRDENPRYHLKEHKSIIWECKKKKTNQWKLFVKESTPGNEQVSFFTLWIFPWFLKDNKWTVKICY